MHSLQKEPHTKMNAYEHIQNFAHAQEITTYQQFINQKSRYRVKPSKKAFDLYLESQAWALIQQFTQVAENDIHNNLLKHIQKQQMTIRLMIENEPVNQNEKRIYYFVQNGFQQIINNLITHHFIQKKPVVTPIQFNQFKRLMKPFVTQQKRIKQTINSL